MNLGGRYNTQCIQKVQQHVSDMALYCHLEMNTHVIKTSPQPFSLQRGDWLRDD